MMINFLMLMMAFIFLKPKTILKYTVDTEENYLVPNI